MKTADNIFLKHIHDSDRKVREGDRETKRGRQREKATERKRPAREPTEVIYLARGRGDISTFGVLPPP